MQTPTTNKIGTESAEAAWVEIVRRHVGPLDFGAVEIVVHDQQVVEIDTTTRVRLAKAPAPSKPKSSATPPTPRKGQAAGSLGAG